ncbi:hypothetical protein GMD78_01730 [Ornithinibacillus sp. L9]|uniref:YceG-like family protein n=1 Tax=Ornithinibacillus caprae TaxID=2678566 RepID=A0A6N8FIH5_9BACI|nr:hypothetical protein [Ornithinibacillus caprae]MUK87118.1 hypothetical protein [Ornithinibacillus caprae]
MKHTIRAFAIGLFSAGLSMLIVHYFDEGTKQDLSEIPVEDIIDQLKEDGYRVLTESEFITLTVGNNDSDEEVSEQNDEENNETEVAKADDDNNEEEAKEDTEDSAENEEKNDESREEQESVKSYTLTIESGMPSSVIGTELEKNGIVDDGRELNQYLDDEGYSLRVQLGEFTFTSDMSFYEIAEKLTR